MPGITDHAYRVDPSSRTGRPLAAIVVLLVCLVLAKPAGAHLSIIRQGAESRGAAEVGDEYGKSVAAGDFNGDGFEDLAVGSPGEAIGSLDAAGAVIVSWGTALGITHVGASLLTQDDWAGAAASAEFGYALAAGDFNHDGRDDLAVGCPGFALSGALPDVGIVYVYRGGSGGLSTWNSVDQGDAGGAHEAGDRYGSSLCVGNFNGDSTPYEDLAVGGPGEDSNAGAIFWFCGGAPNGLLSGPNGWLKQSSLGQTNVAGDNFGTSLAAGQVFGGLQDDLIVGAPYKDTAGITDSGIAYLIAGSSTGLSTTNVLIDATTGDFGSTYQTSGYFGFAVAIGRFYSGLYKGVAIGEPGRTILGIARAGRICVAKGAVGGVDAVGPEAIVLFESAASQSIAANEYFGRALAGGRFDTDDGYDDLVVGVPNDNPGITNAGLLLLFFGGPAGPGGYGWAGFYQGTCNDPSEPGDLFGWSVALGRFDDTGRGNIAAGAPGEDFSTGMVHIIAPWRQRYNLGARTSVAMDCEGNYVFSAKPFDEVCIASTTKAMTLLIACERSQLPVSDSRHVDLDAEYEVQNWIRLNVGGSRYNFEYRETMTLRDLLYAMMFPSGNDAAYAIADFLTGADNNWNGGYAGTCQAFVNEMNIRAIMLGMDDSFFTNPAGLDVGSHHSTAADMMKLARAVIDNPLAAEVVRTSSHDIVDEYWAGEWKSHTRTLGFGFLQNLQARSPDFVGIKPGKTPCAARTGIFAAEEPGQGIAIAGSFGTSADGPSDPYYDSAASLMQLGLAECNYDFTFVPDMPLFRFDVAGLSTQLGKLTGGSVGIDGGRFIVPCVKVDLMRSSSGAPSSAGIDVLRSSETLFAGAEQIDLGIEPFESHGEIVFINQGEMTARFRVTPSYSTGPTVIQLAPGARGTLPAHAAASEQFRLHIENISGDATAIPMLLSVQEVYGFELPSIPGSAGLVFSAEIERAGNVQEDGVQIRCRGTDPSGGAILYASLHELELTVGVPDASLDAAAEDRVTMKPAAPNPFRESTRLAFDLRVRGAVALTIHDVQGRRIRRFEQAVVDPGAWAVVWDGKSDAGASCAAGVYFYRLEVDGRQEAEGRVLRVE